MLLICDNNNNNEKFMREVTLMELVLNEGVDSHFGSYKSISVPGY